MIPPSANLLHTLAFIFPGPVLKLDNLDNLAAKGSSVSFLLSYFVIFGYYDETTVR
jgi:hypothetical protein